MLETNQIIIQFAFRTARDAVWKKLDEDLTAADKASKAKWWPLVQQARNQGKGGYYRGIRAFDTVSQNVIFNFLKHLKFGLFLLMLLELCIMVAIAVSNSVMEHPQGLTFTMEYDKVVQFHIFKLFC